MDKIYKKIINKALTCMLVFSMITTFMPTSVYATEDALTSDKQNSEEIIEIIHSEECEFQEEVEGHECTYVHVHDEDCGYVESKDEIPCDKECTDIDGDGSIDHNEDCAYTPAIVGSPCTDVHEHDETCGYVEAVEGVDCNCTSESSENEIVERAVMSLEPVNLLSVVNSVDNPEVYVVSTLEDLEEAVAKINASEVVYHEIQFAENAEIDQGYDNRVEFNNTKGVNTVTTFVGNNVTLLGSWRTYNVLNLGKEDGSATITFTKTEYHRNVFFYLDGENAELNMYDGIAIKDGYGDTSTGQQASAVALYKGATFNLYGGEISNNQCRASEYLYASTIWSNASYFNMYGGLIDNNYSSTAPSSAIMAYGGQINIQGGTISNQNQQGTATNTARGAAVYFSSRDYGFAKTDEGLSAEEQTLTIKNATIEDNLGAYGGAIYVYVDSEFNPDFVATIENCTFTGNEALYSGGVIYASTGANIIFDECEFIENKATYGGAFFASGVGANVTITDSNFTSNEATSYGGAINANLNSSIILENVTLKENQAAVYGGAIFAESTSTLTLRNVTASDNKATVGGGLYFSATQISGVTTYTPASINIGENVVFEDNTTLDGTTVSNLNIPYDSTTNISSPITILEDLKESSIGITLEMMTEQTTDSDVFTTAYTTAGNSSEKTHFNSDIAGYSANLNNGEVYFTIGYKVSYDTDGGEPTINDTYYIVDDTVIVAAAPTKSGYTFEGWTSDFDELTYQANEDFTMPEADVKLTAQWAEIDEEIEINEEVEIDESTDSEVIVIYPTASTHLNPNTGVDVY